MKLRKRHIIIIVAMLFWEFASQKQHFFLLPVPSKIISSFILLLENGEKFILPSLWRYFLGIIIAISLGVIVGVLLGGYQKLDWFSQPLYNGLRTLPPSAILPVALVWFGIGNMSKVFIIVLGCIWPILINTVQGVKQTPPELYETAKIFGKRHIEIIFSVNAMFALPKIFSGIRISISMGLIMMVLSEMIATSNGLGLFLVSAQRNFQIQNIYAVIVLLSLLGYLGNRIFERMQNKALAWLSDYELTSLH
jgi:ABC-type nitrate/sulfonate/bicarbonate transport system permease component